MFNTTWFRIIMEEGSTHSNMGTKRPRSSLEDNSTLEKSVKRPVNGDDCISKELIVILDAGAQYGKVIDRRIRELHVETIMLPITTLFADIEKYNPSGIIISGSGGSVNDNDSLEYDPAILANSRIPVLGICYGLQLIVKHFGGTVGSEKIREDGQFEVTLDIKCPLFELMSVKEMALLTHGDSVLMLPNCLKPCGWSGDIIVGIVHEDKPIYGVQFHPEVDLTTNGMKIFESFLYKVCGCHGNFKLEDREEQCIEYIRKVVGHGDVLSLVSGGVDSAVCTALLFKALDPSRVTPVHFDTGFMRKGETERVTESLKSLGIDLQVKNETLGFMNARTLIKQKNTDGEVTEEATPYLHMANNAEEKRHIIGDKFIELAEEIMENLKNKSNRPVYLAQGTLRPDLIESASSLASSSAHVIKTHHNDTQLVRDLRNKGLVVEPLKDFHKDEVRKLGESLGLKPDIIYRHPFPGPGLAIRVICQDDPYIDDNFKSTNLIINAVVNYTDRIEESDPIFKLIQDCTSDNERDFLCKAIKSCQLVTTLLPIHTVGVQGDTRTYSYAVGLSSNNPPDWQHIMKLAKLIPRICHSVNRVVWMFGKSVSYPVFDVTPTHLSQGVLATLREADYVAHSILKYNALESKISQMPVVLIPIHFDRNPDQRPFVPSCQRSIVLRPFISSDFMTGIPATPDNDIPMTVILEMVTAIEQIPGISRVLYDLTPKPPGTTEWE